MAWPTSSFPTGLDSITDKVDNVDDVVAADINGAYDCIEKLEAKVGVDSSAVATSLDYKIKNSSSVDPGHLHTDGVGISSRGSNRLINMGISATVSSKIITVALKGENGSDPSATNPVIVAFRDESLTTGTPNIRTITAALSVTLSSGSTLGFAAALAGRIYAWAIDNAGTVELALSRTADIFSESNLVSTTAEGGAGAADSASIMYSATARSNVACRCIGYIEITTGAIAGEWDNAPTKVQIMGPGVYRSGDIVQSWFTSTGAYDSTQVAIPVDDTIPQITEGKQFLSQAITPTSALNFIQASALIKYGMSDYPAQAVAALFNGAANAIDAVADFPNTSGAYKGSLSLCDHRIAAEVAAITYTVRGGPSSASYIFYLNGAAGARLFGGVSLSSLSVMEIFA